MLIKVRDKAVGIIGKIENERLKREWRKRLKNKDFSIICSSCIGGVIYNRLGLQFLSPTINMFFTQRDFIRFAVDLKHYISQDLVFIETDKPYPVAMLDDVTLYFNHSSSREEAANDWNRRKKRINYDNLYLIFYYREGYSMDEIREIEKAKCVRKIMLTSTPVDLPYAYFIKENEGSVNSESFLDKDNFGIHTFEKQWDFVSWLNGKDDGTQ